MPSSRAIRVESVRVAPDGDAPWQLLGARDVIAEASAHRWGHDDWAFTTVELLAMLRRESYLRTELLVAIDPEAAVVGALFARLPLADNRTVTTLRMRVRPGFEGRGVDHALFDAAFALAAREGRTTILFETDHVLSGGPAVTPHSGIGALPADPEARFALERGFALEQDYRMSTFRFPADDGGPRQPGEPAREAVLGRLAELRAEAAAHAGPDYAVHAWQGPTPERWVDALAALLARMSVDVPMAGVAWDEEQWDAARVRARDAERPVREADSLTVVAEHVPSGELAGFTEAEWPLAKPEVGYQADTLVTGPHRGRRLGMLLKATQLGELARVRPTLRRLHTWNAAENTHMLAINEAVGFTATGHAGEWQRQLAGR